ncbi:N-acetylmuramoyl-L-alanine amidase [Ensifer sp. ENS04]|uniref:N-acetylmuramoyl-L-alanine amidase n=1 Tax=Ensifer sp. ENS04 TaxID=2769281 RepID=UPI00177DFBCD|nr:N-acetylmuramoyl-L-alanine amidase [Ensifer sp. ENS04]
MTDTSNQLIKYKPRAETKRIIIHDSHTEPQINAVQDISRWNLDARDGALKMGLLSIGYHFIIERDGHVVTGRPLDLIGSHTPGHNMDSIGVCLVGGREHGVSHGVDNFTREQRKELLKLLLSLTDKYGKLQIKGHSEVQRYRNRSLPPCPAIDMELLREDFGLYQMGITL